jgi:hypothetical protein
MRVFIYRGEYACVVRVYVVLCNLKKDTNNYDKAHEVRESPITIVHPNSK